MDIQFLLRRNKNEEKTEEVEWDPAPLYNCCYYDSSCTKAIISCEGKYEGYLYLVDFNKDRPIDAIPCPKVRTRFFTFDPIETDIFIVGFENGTW